MKREIIKTNDGSVTIRLPEKNETYHSTFGAIQEAKHVFIQNGLDHFKGQPVSVLEIGFGTGLNCYITYLEAMESNQELEYTGIEAYPVTPEEVLHLNYPSQLNSQNESQIFATMHSCDWEKEIFLNAKFSLTKKNMRFEDVNFIDKYNLIYFDAFGYPTQPELWTGDIFTAMYRALKHGGLLTTYACRSIIKKNMQAAGFTVKKLPGPPGKREMLVAYKL